jgi:hypothetical protein
MNEVGLSSRGDTHIDIYQGERGAAELTAEGERLATSLLKAESNQGVKNKIGLSEDGRIDALGRWGNNTKRGKQA